MGTSAQKVVRIGRDADNDVVIDDPRVSGHHARIIVSGSHTLIQDLGSSSGTFVNSHDQNATLATPLSTKDVVFFGSLAVPASRLLTTPTSGEPPAAPPPLQIQKPAPAAPQIAAAPARTVTPAPPIRHPMPLASQISAPPASQPPAPSGTQFRPARVTKAPAPSASQPPETPSTQITAPPPSRSSSSSSSQEPASPTSQPFVPAASALPPAAATQPSPLPATTPSRFRRWTIGLLVQSAVIAGLIVLLLGRQGAAPITIHRWILTPGVAATTFALGLASIFSGASLALWSALAGRRSAHDERSREAALAAAPGSSLLAQGALCALQSAILLAIVHAASGMSGDWLYMLGFLVLTSAVGLSLALVVLGLVRRPWAAALLLLLLFVPMVAFGGWLQPLPRLTPAAKLAAAAMPSRWAFEGLLLLETTKPPAAAISEGPAPPRDHDLAENYFPAESERMGPEADTIALAAMLIALAWLAALIPPRPRPIPSAL